MTGANDQTSTLSAATDAAKGIANSLTGAVTGNREREQAGINQREQASVKHDASQAGASVGGVSVSGSGVAANDERRAQGQADQTTAHLKQAVGGIFSDDLKRQGEREQADAEATQASGQASDLTTGVLDRAAGAVKQAVAADGTTAHAAAKAQHDQGKTLQRGVEAEVKKT